MTADKTYLAVPTLTSFTLVRNKIRQEQEYTNQRTGQSVQRLETGSKRFDATLTTYQPVVKLVDEKPTVVRYTDLGNDSFSYPAQAPIAQVEAGGEPVKTMDELLGRDVIESLRNVLVEVMTGSIPDFADQPPEMAAIGVPRYFHIDRIAFNGREDQASEANLRVLLGVYGDSACTDLRRYIQQDFVSAAIIAGKQSLVADWQKTRDSLSTELAVSGITDERRTELTGQVTQLVKQIAAVSGELEDLQPLSSVVSKPAVKTAIKEITEAVLTDAVESKLAYKNIQVSALMERYDSAYAGLVSAIAKV